MYHYVEDKTFIKDANSICTDLVNQLVQRLKKYNIQSNMYTIGSKRRNMITQNEDEAIDFDYNVLIKNAYDFSNISALKEDIREAFNYVLSVNGLDDCEDSTSALTTKQIVLKKGNRTPFTIDVGIVSYNRFGQLQRLIHKKTGIVAFDQYYWNVVPNSNDLDEKVDYLKPDYWNDVREAYLTKKNMYLSRQDHDHPSFNCYIEAVNEVYNRVRGFVILQPFI